MWPYEKLIQSILIEQKNKDIFDIIFWVLICHNEGELHWETAK